MHVRRAIVTDSPAIARIQVDSYRTAYAGIMPQPYLDQFTYEEETQDWVEILTHQPDEIVYVAENDAGTVIGYALGRLQRDQPIPYDCTLVAMHIPPDFQRQGVGRKLLAALAAHCQGLGCQSLWLQVLEKNTNARAFYERLGGQLLPEIETFEVDDQKITEVIYAWADIEQLCKGA